MNWDEHGEHRTKKKDRGRTVTIGGGWRRGAGGERDEA
jgi:hypothetical protein